MKRNFLVAASLSVFAFGSVMAQDLATSPCASGTSTAGIPNATRAAQDACTQAYDLFQFMAPQLGLALAGGNATLGTGSTLGGLGHFSIGVRANVLQSSLPQVQNFTQSPSGAQRSTLPTKDQYLGLPTADAAIGIFPGIPLGLTNIGGIDLLVSASYVPDVTSGTVTVKPSSSVQVGYGARVGILQESIVVPGVSVTYLKRDLPTTTIIGISGNNSLAVNNLEEKTSAWRIVGSKSFLLFGLAAGYGMDKYESTADIVGTTTGTFAGSSPIPGTKQNLDRSNYFADLSLNLPLFKIVGEIGQSSGGTVQTYNSFSGGQASKSYQYYSAGIRLAF
ncbi:MAG: hypothetical protein JWM95_3465 [Gemmatimonadetes bacterium]|nr:hypothetical protein [Gemmatimonadota bacterium]